MGLKWRDGPTQWTVSNCEGGSKRQKKYQEQQVNSNVGHYFLPGHPAELSDSVKLLLTDAKSHVFDINLILKTIH